MPTAAPYSEELAAKVAQQFEANPRAMTPSIARALEVPEVEVIRHMPGNRSVELDGSRWEEIIRGFEALGLVHVITNTGTVVLEVFGQFGNFSTMGEWFNVQTKSIDMHIRHSDLGAVFAVEKPGHTDGVNTLSFQFFNASGNTAFKVFLTFGGKTPPPEKVEQFNSLRDRFKL